MHGCVGTRRRLSRAARTGRGLARGLCGLALLLLLAAPAAALEAGDRAPSFTAHSLKGAGKLSLSAYRGKVVYLDFWASWCGPCVVSLPLIDELRKEFPAADFQVLAVNVDTDLEKARKFLERRPVGYPSAVDPNGRLPERFGITTMPTSFVIDRQGVIRHVHSGFERGDIASLRKQIVKLVGGSK